MNRYDIICGLDRLIVARVATRHRRHVRAAQRALHEIWFAALQSSEEHAYADGVKAEQDRQHAAEQRGFELGYQHGLDQAIGRIGTPAHRVDEDDLMGIQPS